MAEIYDKQAETFAAFATQSFHWKYMERPAFEKYLQPCLKKGSKVLDVGCGGGRIVEFLIEKGVPAEQITGTDTSAMMVTIAQNKFPKAVFQQASLPEMELSERGFDLITAHMVFEWLNAEELKRALDKLYAHMASGGTLFYITTHPLKLASDDLARYTERHWSSTSAPWGETIPIFNRPLSDYINFTIQAGFNIDFIVELQFSDEIKQEHEEKYNKYRAYGAMRLLVKAHKP